MQPSGGGPNEGPAVLRGHREHHAYRANFAGFRCQAGLTWFSFSRLPEGRVRYMQPVVCGTPCYCICRLFACFRFLLAMHITAVRSRLASRLVSLRRRLSSYDMVCFGM